MIWKTTVMAHENEPLPISDRVQTQFDRVRGNPYAHFVLSELQGATSSLSVYFFFHLVSYLIEKIGDWLPLRLSEPARVLDAIFAWGAVIGGGGSFCIITIFSMLALWRSLRKVAANEL
jgi:hypothetical protein